MTLRKAMQWVGGSITRFLKKYLKKDFLRFDYSANRNDIECIRVVLSYSAGKNLPVCTLPGSVPSIKKKFLSSLSKIGGR